MKNKIRNLILGNFVLVCSVSIAQPTLTATGINPVIGESFTLNGSGFVDPGNSGANQTWDLSAMTSSPGGLTNVVNPATTANGATFTNANIAWSNSTSGVSNYYKTSSAALQNVGLVGGGTVFKYTNGEDFLHFPCVFNNSYVDNWASEFTSGGNKFYRSGTTTVTADGYGTLITPAGTFTNVMRVHFVQEYQDSTDNGGFPIIIGYYNDEYMWYKDGVHVPLALVYELESDISGIMSGGSFKTGSSSGIDNATLITTNFNIFPNPAAVKATIEFSLNGNNKVTVLLYNAMGQQLDFTLEANGTRGVNTLNLDVAELPEGVYFVHINADGILAGNKRLVIAR